MKSSPYSIEERQIIYAKCLSLIIENRAIGLCGALGIVCDTYIDTITISYFFPELFKQKPVKGHSFGFWFSLDKEGRKKRINCLLETIKLCNK